MAAPKIRGKENEQILSFIPFEDRPEHFSIEAQDASLYLFRMSGHKSKNKFDPKGQAAVEYLLTLSGVFIAFAGVAVLFAKQVDHYLSILFSMIVLPF